MFTCTNPTDRATLCIRGRENLQRSIFLREAKLGNKMDNSATAIGKKGVTGAKRRFLELAQGRAGYFTQKLALNTLWMVRGHPYTSHCQTRLVWNGLADLVCSCGCSGGGPCR